jgi:catechol 2,3-dioxygenase-like lactoylglutathione lyase family enzyme
MLATSNIVAFIPTKDSQRARSFYEEILGLRFVSDDAFALVLDANGTSVRITKLKEFTPARYTVLGWEVSRIDYVVDDLRKKGVGFERYEWIQQDEHGIWTAPSGARIAWFKDPDGNVLSISEPITQMDRS